MKQPETEQGFFSKFLMNFLQQNQRKSDSLCLQRHNMASEWFSARKMKTCEKILGWRDVPDSPDCLGKIALQAEPSIRQIFVEGTGLKDEALERHLYLARGRAEKLVKEKFDEEGQDFYITSLSCRTICYKGMFMAWQLFDYYPDLADEHKYVSELEACAAVPMHRT